MATQYRDMLIREDATRYLLQKQRLSKLPSPLAPMAPTSSLKIVDNRYGIGEGGLAGGWQQTSMRKSARPVQSFDRRGSEWYPYAPVRVDFPTGVNSRREGRDAAGPYTVSWTSPRGAY